MTETPHGGTRGPADDPRLCALDRSPILLPDRNEGALAPRAQGRIPRGLHRRAADSHRVGRRGTASSSTPTRRNADAPTIQPFLGRRARPNRDPVIPTGSEVDCESLVVGAA